MAKSAQTVYQFTYEQFQVNLYMFDGNLIY